MYVCLWVLWAAGACVFQIVGVHARLLELFYLHGRQQLPASYKRGGRMMC
jgi:hypothetical protein